MASVAEAHEFDNGRQFAAWLGVGDWRELLADSRVHVWLGPDAADGLVGASYLSSYAGGTADLLPRWAALLVMLGYAAVLALVGLFTTLRRDIG